MIRCLLVVIALFQGSSVFCQEANHYLKSNGKVPSFINQADHFVERPDTRVMDFMDNHTKRAIILDQVLNSGKVIFSNPLTEYLQKISDNLGKDDKRFNIYLIRTNQTITFSFEDNLFVSTGLVAQASGPNQLAFFISREIELNILNKNTEFTLENRSPRSYEEKIKFLSTKPTATELIGDSLGLARYLNASYSADDINYFMDLILYSEMPFDQKTVPVDYFNTENFYVPVEFFDLYGETGDLSFNNSIYFKTLKKSLDKRKELLLQNAGTSNGNTADSKSEEFEKFQLTCRYEAIRQYIVDGNYLNAIYSIFLLEGDDSRELDRLKAHAWTGFMSSSTNLVKSNKILAHQEIHSESSLFFLTLRKLNANGIGSFATRILYDLKTKYGTEEFDLLWDDHLSKLSSSPFFDLEKFSSSSFHEIEKEWSEGIAVSDSINKYEKMEKAELNDQKAFDPDMFYLYGLSDLLKNNFLQSEITRVGKMDDQLVIDPTTKPTIQVYPFIHCNKGNRTINQKKTNKYREGFTNSVAHLSDITPFEIYPADHALSYDEFVTVKEIYSQLYTSNNYDAPMIPLSRNGLASLYGSNDYISIPFFETAYKLKFRRYHMFGLFGVSLPFMIPDMILRSFQSKYTNIIIDTKTGKIAQVDYTLSFEPLTLKLMENRMYKSLQNITNNHSK